MLLKFFKYGKGSVSNAINYLLKDSNNEAKKIIRGNSNLTLSIVDTITTENKYKSGVLSFEEADISSDDKEEIMDLFEATVFAGMDVDDRNILWVQHQDKNRLELHFVIPRIHLGSEKVFNPYYHAIDLERVDTFKNYVNLKYGLTNPNDPKKSRTHSYSNNPKLNLLEKTNKDQLSEVLYEAVAQQHVSNRTELIELLKVSGYELTRMGKEYLSIKTSNMKKAMRFKGGIFSETFTSVGELKREYEEKVRDYQQGGSQNLSRRIKELKQTLEHLNQKKSIYNQKRYQCCHPKNFNTADSVKLSSGNASDVSDLSEQNSSLQNVANTQSFTSENGRTIFYENPKIYSQYGQQCNQTIPTKKRAVNESKTDSYHNIITRSTKCREERNSSFAKTSESRRSLFEKARATRNSSYAKFKSSRGEIRNSLTKGIAKRRFGFINQASRSIGEITRKLNILVNQIKSRYKKSNVSKNNSFSIGSR